MSVPMPKVKLLSSDYSLRLEASPLVYPFSRWQRSFEEFLHRVDGSWSVQQPSVPVMTLAKKTLHDHRDSSFAKGIQPFESYLWK
jgi:hypothetical protein